MFLLTFYLRMYFYIIAWNNVHEAWDVIHDHYVIKNYIKNDELLQ